MYRLLKKLTFGSHQSELKTFRLFTSNMTLQVLTSQHTYNLPNLIWRPTVSLFHFKRRQLSSISNFPKRFCIFCYFLLLHYVIHIVEKIQIWTFKKKSFVLISKYILGKGLIFTLLFLFCIFLLLETQILNIFAHYLPYQFHFWFWDLHRSSFENWRNCAFYNVCIPWNSMPQ